LKLIQQIAKELSLRTSQVETAVRLLDEGNTVPFIARYRKEATDSLDDGALRDLSDRLNYLRGLEKRRGEIASAIEEQGAMTEELAAAIEKANTLAVLEDLYLPFRKKRRTRASVAKEKGLEPLALEIYAQGPNTHPLQNAAAFVNEEKGVNTTEEALAGACDIIAEMISETADVRGALRAQLWREGVVHSVSQKSDAGVYAMYAEFSEAVGKISGYRVLALNRGEKEEVLKVRIESDTDRLRGALEGMVLKNKTSLCTETVRQAAADALTRLILPSLENEVRSDLTTRAAEQAIGVFALNLRPLLLQPPLKGRSILGLDPAYRTGCKIAVIDTTGYVVDTAVIYPTPPHNRVEEANAVMKKLIEKHGVSVIAIGNGTASKESEIFVVDLIKGMNPPVTYAVVSEAGASVYSASKLAAEEFPQYDVSLRSAVSIARRLQDPLAELVKIDPKAIGVGQYQHDMPPARLDAALSGVVEDCVNAVGVDVNTASASLLSYVAGIGPALAKSIVTHRQENGPFASRKKIMEVSRFGKKAYEQAAGFLRIPNGAEMLDNTAVHPESYAAARKLLLLCPQVADLKEEVARRGKEQTAQAIGVGVPTLLDIAEELLKPGRDPRENLEPLLLRSDLLQLSDLKPGMEIDGTVRNVVDFGAFVDIGVHQDGLVHISQITNRFLRHPSEALQVGQIVRVRVLGIDEGRKRISLTMRLDLPFGNPQQS
jgi:uncharacterized protein